MKVFLAGTSLAGPYGGPAVSVSRLALSLSDLGHEVGLWAADQSASQTPLLPPGAAVRRLTGPAAQAMNSFVRPDVIHDNGIWLSHNHRLAALATRCAIPRIVSTRGMLEPWAMAHKRWKKRLAWRLYQNRDLKEARCHHATSERLPPCDIGERGAKSHCVASWRAHRGRPEWGRCSAKLRPGT
jgi:hypothetical protein